MFWDPGTIDQLSEDDIVAFAVQAQITPRDDTLFARMLAHVVKRSPSFARYLLAAPLAQQVAAVWGFAEAQADVSVEAASTAASRDGVLFEDWLANRCGFVSAPRVELAAALTSTQFAHECWRVGLDSSIVRRVLLASSKQITVGGS